MINRWAILVYRQLRYFIIPVYINVYFFYIYAYLSLTMTINICSILSYMRKKSVNMFFFKYIVLFTQTANYSCHSDNTQYLSFTKFIFPDFSKSHFKIEKQEMTEIKHIYIKLHEKVTGQGHSPV